MHNSMLEELTSDPVALAVAVLVERIRGLSAEDRDDLFELTEALRAAETDEEYEAASRGMREILKQQDKHLRPLEFSQPTDKLRSWMEFVGGRIQHYRKTAGLTQEELATKSGLPQSHISRLERGHHSPSSLTLTKIAAALGIDTAELDPSS